MYVCVNTANTHLGGLLDDPTNYGHGPPGRGPPAVVAAGSLRSEWTLERRTLAITDPLVGTPPYLPHQLVEVHVQWSHQSGLL